MNHKFKRFKDQKIFYSRMKRDIQKSKYTRTAEVQNKQIQNSLKNKDKITIKVQITKVCNLVRRLLHRRQTFATCHGFRTLNTQV